MDRMTTNKQTNPSDNSVSSSSASWNQFDIMIVHPLTAVLTMPKVNKIPTEDTQEKYIHTRQKAIHWETTHCMVSDLPIWCLFLWYLPLWSLSFWSLFLWSLSLSLTSFRSFGSEVQIDSYDSVLLEAARSSITNVHRGGRWLPTSGKVYIVGNA